MSRQSDPLAVFRFFGIILGDENGSGQCVSDCPLCGDDGEHFYVSAEKGLWDCKVCGEKGNPNTFPLALYSSLLTTGPDNEAAAALWVHRAEKGRAFDSGPVLLAKNWSITLSRVVQDCPYIDNTTLLGIHDWEGKLVSVLKYELAEKSRPLTPPGLKKRVLVDPWKDSKEKITSILLCEGEWDALYASHLLRKTGAVVLGIPGASSGSGDPSLAAACALARSKHLPVQILFDNDEAGEKGAASIAKKLSSEHGLPAKQVYSAVWPPDATIGHDLTDALTHPDSPYCAESPTKGPAAMLSVLEAFFPPSKGKSLLAKPSPSSQEGAEEHSPAEITPITFPEMVAEFEKTGVRFTPAFEDALLVSCATVVASQSPGESVWLYLIGPSGSGKSLILESVSGASSTYFQTALKRTSLISGFMASKEDPSLLSRIVDPPKCLVVKDYTTVLTMPKPAFLELTGVLRDAFDGKVDLLYGNAQHRVYEGRFGFLTGVTPAIHRIRDTELGARMLKYEFLEQVPEEAAEELLLQLISDDTQDHKAEHEEARRVAAQRFLDPLCEDIRLPPLDRERGLIIASLAQWVAIGRGVVERNYHNEPEYAPSTEDTKRVTQQLARLARSVAYCEGASEVTDRALRIVAKCAWDTAFSRSRNVLGYLTYKGPRSVSELQREMRLHETSVSSALRDLCDFNAVVPPRKTSLRRIAEGGQGRPNALYILSESFHRHAERTFHLLPRESETAKKFLGKQPAPPAPRTIDSPAPAAEETSPAPRKSLNGKARSNPYQPIISPEDSPKDSPRNGKVSPFFSSREKKKPIK